MMRSRALTAVLSFGLGGCVIVLPSCPGRSTSTEVPSEPAAPAEAVVPPPPPTPEAPPYEPVEPTAPRGSGSLSLYALTVLQDEPAAYWRFEENGGFVASDESGRDHNGSYIDGPLHEHGAAGTGRALSLRSATDGVVIPYAPWTDAPNMTVEAWVRASRVSSPEGMIVVDKGNTWNLYLDPVGRPAFQLPGDVPPETIGPTAIVPGQDYHLVGTFQNGAMALYVNGVLVSYGNARVRAMPSNRSPIHVGRGLGAERWDFYGVIDDVALYDQALSPAAVLRHYRAGLVDPRSGR